MKHAIVMLAWLSAGFVTGCGSERCDMLEAPPVVGSYALLADSPQELPSGVRAVSASLDAENDLVVVQYETPSGARFRARYRVTQRPVER